VDVARARLDALPWWRWRARTNAQWRLEQAKLLEPPEQPCPRHTWLVMRAIRDGIITVAELAAARPPEPPLSQQPGVDPAFTEDQLQALHQCIGTKGFDYFFMTYTDAEGWATDHGPLPLAVVEGWRAYQQAHEKLAALIGLTGIGVRSHWPGVGVDPGFTEEQLEALHECVDWKGFGYFFTTYTDAEGWAAEHGSLPPAVIEAWREYARAHEKLATLIGVRS
jgi:hypothetical protein